MTLFSLNSRLSEAVKSPGRKCVAIWSVTVMSLLIQRPMEVLRGEELSLLPLAPTQKATAQTDNGDDSKSPNHEKGISQGHPSSDQQDRNSVDVNPITGVGTASAVNYRPLTGRERWRLYFKQNFTTVGAYLGVLVGSALDEVEHQPPEWGQDTAGYGQRLVARLGTSVVQGTLQAPACALLGQDPRYIRSGSEKPWSRAGHAFLYSLLTYNNEGKPRLAAATLGSYYASSMIATSWLPARYTPLGDGVRDGNRQVILAGLSNLVQEFWPEIKKILSRK